MMYWQHHMTSGGWIFSIFTTIILVALLVAAGVWTIRLIRKPQAPERAGTASALEILDRRLASGEIKVDQYEQLRHTLAARHE
jgi:uncharacterized membrane protein